MKSEHLGFCLDLEALDAPNIEEVGDGIGEWATDDALHGTFTATFAAANNCTEGEESEPANDPSNVRCTFKIKGCGKLKFTIAGDGSNNMPVVNVRRRSSFVEPPLTVNPWVLIMVATGGSAGGCNPSTINAVVPSGSLELEKLFPCGEEFELRVSVGSYNRTAEIVVTIAVEVITE